METDAVAGDPMETEVVEGSVEEGRSNTDLIGHCSDSDSYSKLVHWKRGHFSYELPGLRDIPDYRVPSSYTWKNDKQNEKEEDEGVYFLKVTDKSWSHLSDEQKRGRWDEHPRMVRSIRTASPNNNSSSASSSPERVVADAQPPSLRSSAEVLRVRMEMHECFEKGISCRRLFKSKANKEELRFHNAHDEPHMLYVNRHGPESTMRAPSYAHFPKLSGVAPIIPAEWVKPTTLEGDKQYLEFFRRLVETTEYGHTKDHVLAKAIVLARKSCQNMLFFQIEFAVEDCMKLLENEERMKQRYDLYYFVVSEAVLNKDCPIVVKGIRACGSGLPCNLTEFGAYYTNWAADMVDYLVTHLCAKREHGLYKERVFEKVDEQGAKLVIGTVDEQFRSGSRYLYMDLLIEKIRIAQDLGLVPPEDTNLE